MLRFSPQHFLCPAPGQILSAAQFDAVAIGVDEVKRLPPARGTEPFSSRPDFNAPSEQVIPHLADFEVVHGQAEVVHIALRSCGERLTGKKIDESLTCAQMCQQELVAAPFEPAPQTFAIESDGTVKVRNPDDDMIDSGDLHS